MVIETGYVQILLTVTTILIFFVLGSLNPRNNITPKFTSQLKLIDRNGK